MRAKTAIIIVVSFLFITLCTTYGYQEPEWKGTITTEEGVRIVSNPREPLYGEIRFELVEDLSIGNETDDNFMFFGIFDIDVDDDGNIYVLERGNRRVQKFDANGRYILTIGRMGEGPGEFMFPSRVLMEPGKKALAVRDGRSLIFFDLNGKYLDRDVFTDMFLLEPLIGEQNSILGYGGNINEADELGHVHHNIIVRLNYKGELLNQYAKYPNIRLVFRSPTGGTTSISTGHEPSPYLTLLSGNTLVYGYSKDYELFVVGMGGDLRLKIRKDASPPKYTKKEIEAFELQKARWKDLKLQQQKPFFYFIHSDDMDRIYVQRNMGRRFHPGEKELDIFSIDGYYLYKTTIPYTPLTIKNGYIYSFTVNEETGDTSVHRFKIKNWDQIKTSIN